MQVVQTPPIINEINQVLNMARGILSPGIPMGPMVDPFAVSTFTPTAASTQNFISLLANPVGRFISSQITGLGYAHTPSTMMGPAYTPGFGRSPLDIQRTAAQSLELRRLKALNPNPFMVSLQQLGLQYDMAHGTRIGYDTVENLSGLAVMASPYLRMVPGMAGILDSSKALLGGMTGAPELGAFYQTMARIDDMAVHRYMIPRGLRRLARGKGLDSRDVALHGGNVFRQKAVESILDTIFGSGESRDFFNPNKDIIGSLDAGTAATLLAQAHQHGVFKDVYGFDAKKGPTVDTEKFKERSKSFLGLINAFEGASSNPLEAYRLASGVFGTQMFKMKPDDAKAVADDIKKLTETLKALGHTKRAIQSFIKTSADYRLNFGDAQVSVTGEAIVDPTKFSGYFKSLQKGIVGLNLLSGGMDRGTMVDLQAAGFNMTDLTMSPVETARLAQKRAILLQRSEADASLKMFKHYASPGEVQKFMSLMKKGDVKGAIAYADDYLNKTIKNEREREYLKYNTVYTDEEEAFASQYIEQVAGQVMASDIDRAAITALRRSGIKLEGDTDMDASKRYTLTLRKAMKTLKTAKTKEQRREAEFAIKVIKNARSAAIQDIAKNNNMSTKDFTAIYASTMLTDDQLEQANNIVDAFKVSDQTAVKQSINFAKNKDVQKLTARALVARAKEEEEKAVKAFREYTKVAAADFDMGALHTFASKRGLSADEISKLYSDYTAKRDKLRDISKVYNIDADSVGNYDEYASKYKLISSLGGYISKSKTIDSKKRDKIFSTLVKDIIGAEPGSNKEILKGYSKVDILKSLGIKTTGDYYTKFLHKAVPKGIDAEKELIKINDKSKLTIGKLLDYIDSSNTDTSKTATKKLENITSEQKSKNEKEVNKKDEGKPSKVALQIEVITDNNLVDAIVKQVKTEDQSVDVTLIQKGIKTGVV